MKSLLTLVATVSLSWGLLACGGSGKGASPAAHPSSAPPSGSGGGLASGGTSAGAGASQGGTATTVAAGARRSNGLKGDEDDDDTAANETPGNRTGDNDADFDNDMKDNAGKGYLDGDDAQITHFGQPATAAQKRAITAVVQRYYAAALAGDGAAGCRLIYSVMVEAIPEDYGSGAGPSYARGKTCSVVMTKIYQHEHARLVGDAEVTDVRVKRKAAYALLGSHTQPARYLRLRDEMGAWKTEGLLPVGLP